MAGKMKSNMTIITVAGLLLALAAGFLIITAVSESEIPEATFTGESQTEYQIVQEPLLERYEQARRHSAIFFLSWKAVEILDLDDETVNRFVPLFVEYNNIHDKLNKEKRVLSFLIKSQSENNSVSVGEIRETIKSMAKIEGKIREERTKFINKSKNILTERQTFKLFVLDEIMKDEIMNSGPGGSRLTQNTKNLEHRWRLLERIIDENK
jgi:hypothetical protein